jgi:hypothetical protein
MDQNYMLHYNHHQQKLLLKMLNLIQMNLEHIDCQQQDKLDRQFLQRQL